jgi:predicted O-methyltransferase YrrM
MYKYTHAWFYESYLYYNIKDYFLDINAPLNILEIGCYEGLSSCYFSDELLNNPDSTLDCVDPWNLEDSTTPVKNNTYDIFINNIALSKNKEKIKVHKKYSNEFFSQIENNKLYDIIYIDGSHIPEDVKFDMDNSFKVLKKGGMMWMDDYMSTEEVKSTIDEFVKSHNKEIKVFVKKYQLALKKLI